MKDTKSAFAKDEQSAVKLAVKLEVKLAGQKENLLVWHWVAQMDRRTVEKMATMTDKKSVVKSAAKMAVKWAW